MAKQDAEKFLQYLSNDITTQNQLLTMSGMDGILDCAFSKGYVFTEDDLRAALPVPLAAVLKLSLIHKLSSTRKA